jgi:hypothetical protein
MSINSQAYNQMPQRTTKTSTAIKLHSLLQSITEGLIDFARHIPVKHFNKYHPGVVVVAPDYYWEETTTAQKTIQLNLKRKFDAWAELFRLALKNAPQELLAKQKQAITQFEMWLNLTGNNWSVSPDALQNELEIRKASQELESLVNILGGTQIADIIVVPDTNAIIEQPDPVKYRTALGADAFTFLLLPTVLSELDQLKNHHRDPAFREKVKKVITRIKGWRQQGNLTVGVKVAGTITVRTIANEPNMNSTLSWLDATVRDDRIIASILELQVANTASRVVLVTGDINLQNKSEAAMIEYLDL